MTIRPTSRGIIDVSESEPTSLRASHTSRSAVPAPNTRLVELIGDVPPGNALELGCDNGDDALWLALGGRTVTAEDIPATVIQRLDLLAHAGGRLVIVDHGSTHPRSWNQDLNEEYPHPDQMNTELDLDPKVWITDTPRASRRIAIVPGNRTAEVTDHLLLIRRVDLPSRESGLGMHDGGQAQ